MISKCEKFSRLSVLARLIVVDRWCFSLFKIMYLSNWKCFYVDWRWISAGFKGCSLAFELLAPCAYRRLSLGGTKYCSVSLFYNLNGGPGSLMWSRNVIFFNQLMETFSVSFLASIYDVWYFSIFFFSFFFLNEPKAIKQL